MIHEDYAVERLGREGWPEDAGCESVNLALARRSSLVVGFTTVGDELRVAVVPSVKSVEEIAMSWLIPGCAEQKIPDRPRSISKKQNQVSSIRPL